MSIDLQIADVVQNGNCSGCGACCQLDPGLEMTLSTEGYLRPERKGPATGRASEEFDRICPGRRVDSQRPAGGSWHPTMGPVVESWQGWASDDEIRFRGSSGGALTALTTWLVESGRATDVIGAAADPVIPTRTITVAIRSRGQALAAAGSRYAPVSNAAMARLGDPDAVFIGKPCEVSAVRALAELRGVQPPLLLSFFCAGTPSQHATEELAGRLGDGSPPAQLWYRGRGWPGSFTVVSTNGRSRQLSYDESWGTVLGPTMQWRCKICPDGVGESADIVAADYWHSDERGYPVFAETEGISAILARTLRGEEILRAAVTAGALQVHALSLDALAAVQPFQSRRRRSLFGRLAGTRLAGRKIPRYRGFGLWRHAVTQVRGQLRIAKGSYQRVRSNQADR